MYRNVNVICLVLFFCREMGRSHLCHRSVYREQCDENASSVIADLMDTALRDPLYLRLGYKPDCQLHGVDDVALPRTDAVIAPGADFPTTVKHPPHQKLKTSLPRSTENLPHVHIDGGLIPERPAGHSVRFARTRVFRHGQTVRQCQTRSRPLDVFKDDDDDSLFPCDASWFDICSCDRRLKIGTVAMYVSVFFSGVDASSRKIGRCELGMNGMMCAA